MTQREFSVGEIERTKERVEAIQRSIRQEKGGEDD